MVKRLETAELLIDWLDRDKWGADPIEWVFRGQRSADWCLSPSAWRPSEMYLQNGKWVAAPTSTKGQCQLEYEIARRFFKLSDVQGLPLPGDNPDLRARLVTQGEFDKHSDWPPIELEWLIGIAQHYGIPTRFLDWTRKPQIAAWFACEAVAQQLGKEEEDKKPLSTGRFVVWALHRNSKALAKSGWIMTSAPRAAVPNLHLQSGVFSFRREVPAKFRSAKNIKPLCKALAGSKKIDNVIRAASVPWSQAGRLLQLLRDRFVQAATVYSGYEGVARSVKEHRWRR